MLNLFKFLLVLALVAGVAGYFLGWYDFNVGVNAKKINDDLKGAGVDGVIGPIGGDGNASKDDKGTAPGKDDKGTAPGKDDRTPAGKSDGPKKDRVVTSGNEPKDPASVKEERAEGFVAEIAPGMPRFTVRLIDSTKKMLDNRYVTFDLAPKSEVRVNEALSDFRSLHVRSKVIVTYYLEADPTNMAPPKNMARLIVIERAK